MCRTTFKFVQNQSIKKKEGSMGEVPFLLYSVRGGEERERRRLSFASFGIFFDRR